MFTGGKTAELQKMQDAFCTVGHVCAILTDTDLNPVTEFTGDDTIRSRIDEVLNVDCHRELLEKFDDVYIDDVIPYDSSGSDIMFCGVALRDGRHKLCGVWFVYAIADEGMAEEQFDYAAGLVECIAHQLSRADSDRAEMCEKVKTCRSNEIDNAARLKKSEVMTEILTEMESDDTFVRIAESILTSAGTYTRVSQCCLLKIDSDANHAEMICEWVSSDDYSRIREFGSVAIAELPFVTGRPYTVSGSGELPEKFRVYFDTTGVTAGIYLPVSVGNKLAMYLCFQMYDTARVWDAYDLGFFNDVRRVIQTTLTNHVTKNSLAGSYTALEQILENIGCGVVVYDTAKSEVLYVNDNFNNIEIEESDRKGLMDCLKESAEEMPDRREFFARQSDMWFEISFSHISWVDGRKVRLVTVYDLTQTKQYQKEIERRAGEDYLTGLYNRMKCEKDLEKMIRSTVRSADESALLYMDLDDFDHINDAIGHQNGDILLKKAADELNRIEGVSNHCYRIGGDEFVILISNRHYGRLEKIIAKVKSIFSKPWSLAGQEYYCTMSMGVVILPRDGVSVDALMQRADIALHWAKSHGKNRVEYYDSEQASDAGERLEMERAMRAAVEQGCEEFEVYYQPLIDISKNENACCGAEALLRWKSKILGMVMPAKFIPLAEYLGLINEIGRHVLAEAAARCKYWNDFGHPEYKVNVNLSVVQLVQADIANIIQDVIDSTGISPSNLTLEVTESLAVNDMDRMQQVLAEIKALGVNVALDDFGTGYSSLNHLRSMPIDVIKIDKCFVSNIGEDDFSEAFVSSVSQLADSMDVCVVVEGVEQERQKALLDEMKIDMVQGFLFDKPMPREEFEDKYLG